MDDVDGSLYGSLLRSTNDPECFYDSAFLYSLVTLVEPLLETRHEIEEWCLQLDWMVAIR